MLESPMIDRIKQLDIPVTSALAAANYIRDKMAPKMVGNKRPFDSLIKLVTEQNVATSTAKEAELIFSYVVYEAVSHHVKKEFKTIDETITVAKQKADKLMTTMGCNNPNSNFKAPVEETTPGAPVTKQRIARGSGQSKKDRCLALYKEKIELPEFKDQPKKMIELFMNEFGLSKPGATTYEYNCRKGIWV